MLATAIASWNCREISTGCDSIADSYDGFVGKSTVGGLIDASVTVGDAIGVTGKGFGRDADGYVWT
jgi:hypothetical protein